MAPLFTSDRDNWTTPQWLFDACYWLYGFRLDAAASEENALCEAWYDVESNGLINPWDDRTWCNCPYGRTATPAWVKKASDEATLRISSVLLLPARTDTRWFHSWIYGREDVSFRFIQGRLKFGHAKSGAPFPGRGRSRGLARLRPPDPSTGISPCLSRSRFSVESPAAYPESVLFCTGRPGAVWPTLTIGRRLQNFQ